MAGLITKLLAALGVAFLLFGQDGGQGENPLRARDLYLEGTRAPASSGRASADTPLGLRYTILKRQQNSEYMAVDPQEEFRSGDRIRLRIEVNNNGYLYVVHKGSSGIWQALYPPSDAEMANNEVQKGGAYEIPAGLSWAFDQKPGIERLLIVFSRQQQPSLEGLVDAVRGEPEAQPEKTGSKSQTYMASVEPPPTNGKINDDVVVQMSQMHSRDLKLETVYEKDEENKTVPAVYVANPSEAPDALVLKEINLIHR